MRKSNWDFAKAILMYIVIYGHVCPAISDITYKDTWCALTRVTGLFVMPLFFLISGYFQSTITSVKSLVEKYKKSFIRIALPLLSWGLLMLTQLNISCTQDFFCTTKYILSRVTCFYWFLSALLLCIFIGSLFSLIGAFNKKLLLGLLAVSLPIFSFLKYDIFHFSFIWFYYGSGMIYKLLESNHSSWMSKLRDTNILFMCLSVICAIIGLYFYPENSFYFTSNQFAKDNIMLIVFRYILCLTSSICALHWIFVLYNKFISSPIVSYLTSLGQGTLFIYCSHCFLLSFIVRPYIVSVCGTVGILENFDVIRLYILSPILTFVLYYFLQNVADCLKRYRFVRVFLMGLSK